ncbi:MAG: hypothetical protein B0D92_00650 [Spirochaeta sp. LUC14_002_19_P3]|nr:MAG: hypothetical protein B0D92_00650 [Spirochaeta sp. LUC14_002_19_P3]
MRKDKNLSIKLKSISIENYKGIDSFSMDFPMPTLPEDPDILVMGSENGLGKTSIIECCALLLMCLRPKKDSLDLMNQYFSIDVPDLLIRAGTKFAKIAGAILIADTTIQIAMRIDRSGEVDIRCDSPLSELVDDAFIDDDRDEDELIKAICGFSLNPVIENSFLLFHSYRKVQEGNPELGMMVRDSRTMRRRHPLRRMETPLSEFKLLILRSLMNQAELFELPEEKPEETINTLNELVKFYAKGTISKLRPSADNTVDFRIMPVNGGKSFTFDGLSSGQKEIISTLFLIWYHTKNNPSVVFIDEPELHLNAQWHRSFVKKLIQLVPKNQYIVATHSEDIMDSVAENRRILLQNEKENGND